MPVVVEKVVEQTVVDKIVEVVCNVCSARSAFPVPGFHIWRLEGGYGDTFPADMDRFTIVVCEPCLKKWVGTFEIQQVMEGGEVFCIQCERYTVNGVCVCMKGDHDGSV